MKQGQENMNLELIFGPKSTQPIHCIQRPTYYVGMSLKTWIKKSLKRYFWISFFPTY